MPKRNQPPPKRPPQSKGKAGTQRAATVKQSPPTPPKKTGGFLNRLFERVFGAKQAPQTAQQSIPYREMYRDGICRVDDNRYSKTIAFQDINYQLAQNEDKSQIFESFCDFLNYFDSTRPFQQTFSNQYGDVAEFENSITISDQDDAHNEDRREYSDMLKNQLSKGNNGIIKTKYVTISVEAGSLKEAKTRIERVEVDALNNFKTLGVKAHSLTGKDIDGYTIQLDLTEVRELNRLLRNATNNLNQIARRVNETRSIYGADIKDLQDRLDQLWERADGIMRALAKL